MPLIHLDDLDGLIWLDGAMVPWRDARVHVLTHALHYATAAFEGIRVYQGSAFKLEAHIARLINSARLIGFDIPWSAAQLEAACRELVEVMQIAHGYLRPLAWRGAITLGGPTQETRVHAAIAGLSWPADFMRARQLAGMALTVSRWARPAPNTFPTAAKASGLYMVSSMVKHEAENAGFDDALLLDWRGRIAEASGANVFLVVDGALHTPAPDCFLDGITRRAVIALARARGIAVIERAIMPTELAAASEVFMTGTGAAVTPISAIDEHRFSIGPLTQRMIGDYDALVRSGG